jgi:hypothetical protein
VALVVAASMGACAAAAPTAGTAVRPKARARADFDPCESSKPVWREYRGPLQRARCEQDMFLTMAGVAEQLDVGCEACHVKTGPKSFDYPKMTEMKKKALWMDHYFMDNLKRRDGDPMTCKSCHLDRNGKPSLHFLGTPRDIPYAVEWMTNVMTSRFVLPDGSTPRCTTCHGANFGMPGFKSRLISTELPFAPAPPADLFAEPPPAPSAPSAPASSAPVAPAGAPSAAP